MKIFTALQAITFVGWIAGRSQKFLWKWIDPLHLYVCGTRASYPYFHRKTSQKRTKFVSNALIVIGDPVKSLSLVL